jgi:hypothetical protein
MAMKLPLSGMKKWRSRFANGRVTLEDGRRYGSPPECDVPESEATLINESPFISYHRASQKLRIMKTTCLHVLCKNLGSENVINDGLYV